MLVAKRPILYRSKMYKIGDQLPADNKEMVKAWLEAESAEWKDETTDASETAEPEADAPEGENPEEEESAEESSGEDPEEEESAEENSGENPKEEPKAKTITKKTATKKGAK